MPVVEQLPYSGTYGFSGVAVVDHLRLDEPFPSGVFKDQVSRMECERNEAPAMGPQSVSLNQILMSARSDLHPARKMSNVVGRIFRGEMLERV
jgi:hypothetical protein